MIITPTSLRTTRRITPAAGGSFGVQDGVDQWFRGEIIPPVVSTAAYKEGPPRDRDPWVLRWNGGTLGPGAYAPSRPSERIESAGQRFELLGLPRQLRSGRRVIGVEVAVMKVDDLYPYSGILQEQGGEVVLPDMQFALWEPDDINTDHGHYTTYQGEAPPNFVSALTVANRQIVFNGVVFRIIDPFLVLQVPRVRFTLRGVR